MFSLGLTAQFTLSTGGLWAKKAMPYFFNFENAHTSLGIDLQVCCSVVYYSSLSWVNEFLQQLIFHIAKPLQKLG